MAQPQVNEKISLHVFLLAACSVFIWCYLFRFFLDGRVHLQGDAFPYLGHIRFYLENMMQGVYPLWDPLRENGNVNEFFLRRIGEFNPFFWFIALLNKIGFTFVVAHRWFLGGYYFLGVTGFYLLSQRLFADRRVSLISVLVLMFSALGSKAFESFILLEIVPALWFAYFLVAFAQTPRQVFLLGAVFCLMIINITYVPFYFYTTFLVFLLCFVIVYAPHVPGYYRRIKSFCAEHVVFAIVCAGLWLVSLVPGFLWYQVLRLGEAFSMSRHAGSLDSNFATVGIDKINEGGILAYLILDRQFVHLDQLELGDFYVPVFAFLLLLTMIWSRLNRRLIFLFLFGSMMFLIGIADASLVHTFLYHHVPFFKYFRNFQFFLWLAVLPVFILFVMEGMRGLIRDFDCTADRRWMSVWVVLVHTAAAAFCCLMGTTGLTVYAVIVLSLFWMLGRIWGIKNEPVLLWIIWLAVILQPLEVYSHFASAYPPQEESFAYEFRYESRLPSSNRAQEILKGTCEIPSGSNQISFSIRWFNEAVANVERQVLFNYSEAPFILYDGVEATPPDTTDYKHIERSMADFRNVALVHSDHGPEGRLGPLKARILTATDEDFKVLTYDANRMTVRTAFSEPHFLVRTSNYHSQWKAFIDDKPAELFRTDIFAQGLWIPEGEHVIEWRYGKSWRYPLAFVFVGLYAGILGVVVWLSWRLRTYSQK